MSSPHCQLIIDLDALADNWRALNSHVGRSECAAVVKADAYGLGVAAVAKKLFAAGCRHFFVASLAEGLTLRALLDGDSSIYLLAGVFPGEELACAEAGLIPVLHSLPMLKRWHAMAKHRPCKAALKLDSGMGRLGLTQQEFAELCANPEWLLESGIVLVLSHLACADEPSHAQNSQQLQRFKSCRERLLALNPALKFSLANSAGCLLGEQYHFDLVRPGIALYGSNGVAGASLSFKSVLSLHLKILSLRAITEAMFLGYGAAYQAQSGQLIATVAGGYADGLLRSLSGRAAAYVDGVRVPMCGRVSMDSVLFDVSVINGLAELPELNWPALEVLGEHQSVDDLAAAAGTIAYEILTSMGERFSRRYLG